MISTNNGTVVVKSTNGTGITTGNFIDSNNGSLTIQSGTFSTATSVVSESNGTIEVQSGTFNSDNDCFSKIYGNLTIHDAEVTVSSGNCIYVIGSGNVEIFGGTYIAPDDCINNQGTVIIHAGASFEATDDSDGCLYSNGGNYEIADDAIASPSAWEKASKVDFVSAVVTIRFYSEGKLLSEINEIPANRAFPDNPVNSKGLEFCFWEDKDGNRVNDLSALTTDTDLYAVFTDKNYTVSFNDKGNITTETVAVNTLLGKVPGLDRMDNGDNFRCWKLGNEIVDSATTTPVCSNLTLTAVYGSKVMNFDELKAAIDRKDAAIELGADISVTETLTVNYDCVINGGGFGLIRPENFTGVLLSVENGVTGGESDSGVQGDGTTLIVKNVKVDGRNLDADAAAVTAGDGTTLIMDNVTVENNRNTTNDGGIYADNADITLKNCTIANNYTGYSGGGIYAKADGYNGASKSFVMDNCTIKGNSADNEGGGLYQEDYATKATNCVFDGNTADDGGGLLCSNQNYGSVSITDSTIRNNTASSEGGGMKMQVSIVHLYGNTQITKNTAANGGGVQSSWGDKDTCILYMHGHSSITYNTAKKDEYDYDGKGGGVNCDELRLVMYDNSSIDHNTAETDGGGVYAASYGMLQNGGVIRDNHADGSGGGVYVQNDSSFTAGMMFDNTADEEGDDLFARWDLNTLYPEQSARKNGDGNSKSLKTVLIEKIPDYYPADEGSIDVPWYGWFVDGEWDSEEQEYNNHYTGDIETSKLVSAENGNQGILTGDIDDTGVKAIWYGMLLAYDANYEGTTDHQYDEQAYRPGTDATVKDNMFERSGYRFVGWNTKKDGSGENYTAGQALTMKHSQVLYAQWERIEYFNVVHVKEKGTEVSDPEKIELTSEIKKNGYNLTGLVPEGYIYGGAFKDEKCQKVYPFADGENGISFHPEAGKTYYIWEVNEKYLEPKTFCVWLHTGDGDNKDVIELYFLTPIDRLLYSEAGFTMDGTDYASEKDGENLAYGAIEASYIRRQDRKDLLYLKDGYMQQKTYYKEGDSLSKDEGYIGAYKLTDEQFADFKERGCTFQPYWITLDGVKVTGVNERACSYNGVGVETRNEMITVNNKRVGSVCTNVNTTASGAMQYASAYTIIADPENIDPADKLTITVNDNGNTYEIAAKAGDDLNVTYKGADGKVFAGWYTDEKYTTPADLSNVQKNMTIYVKYVSDNYLQVKYVTLGLLRVRSVTLLSAVEPDMRDSGFIVNGKKIDSVTLGRHINLGGASYLFGVDSDALLTTGSYSLKNAKDGEKIEVTPYWITADGTTVYGKKRVLTYKRFGLRG